MKIFRKVGVSWLLFLIGYCAILISLILFIGQPGVSLCFYFIDGEWLFKWRGALYISLTKGCVTGLFLGVGLWVKAKLQEKRIKKVYWNKKAQ